MRTLWTALAWFGLANVVVMAAMVTWAVFTTRRPAPDCPEAEASAGGRRAGRSREAGGLEARALGARYLAAYVAGDTETMRLIHRAATDRELLGGVLASARTLATSSASASRISPDELLAGLAEATRRQMIDSELRGRQ